MKTFAFLFFLIVVGVKGLKNGVDSFDVSEKWPQCKDVFEGIQSQGNCYSSWAISVATSIRDRRCIKFGVKEPISAYDLISCCSDCQLDGKNGCNGGDHASAFHYFIDQGIVSGGAYRSFDGCKPYPIRPDPEAEAPTNTECFKSCESSYKTSYEKDKVEGSDKVIFSYNNKGVMDEIMKNGPVVAEFELFDDFLSYKSGIYHHKNGKLRGYYYAKILGWSIDADTQLPFWRAAASFGRNWGENGTFRIIRGSNECKFESNIIGGIIADTPDIKSTTTAVSKPPDLKCQKITATYNGKFQSISNQNVNFYSQIQVTADINLDDKRIYFKFDSWNKEYTLNYWFSIFNDAKRINCNTTQKDCSILFISLSKFGVDFEPVNYGYPLEMIHIEPLLNNSFTLENAIRNCATSLKNNVPTDTDTSLYQSCFCCGDKYNPDPSLNCPASP